MDSDEFAAVTHERSVTELRNIREVGPLLVDCINTDGHP